MTSTRRVPNTEYRSPLAALIRRLGTTIFGAKRRGGTVARLRLRQLEVFTMIAVQSGLAAGLSWWIAHDALGNPNPVFAPTAAVGTIAAALGQRTRRTVELLLGIGVGILIGDGLVYLIGSGAWQTAVIVTLAIGVALGLAGRGGTIVSQVGGTAVLIATLSSSQRDLATPRVIDAVIGSVVALAVVALLLPLHPIRIIKRAGGPVFRNLVNILRSLEQALRTRDNRMAIDAMRALQAMGADVERMQDAAKGAEEVVTIAPVRWSRRPEFKLYNWGVRHLVHVVDDSQDLARRAATALQYRERLPGHIAEAVGALADAVDRLHRDVGQERPHQRSRRLALHAVAQSGCARVAGLATFGSAVATQVRITASDILRTTGCSIGDANRRVRLAAHLGQAHMSAQQAIRHD